jgi:hypothetical protein
VELTTKHLDWLKGLIELPQIHETTQSIVGKSRDRRVRARCFHTGTVISLSITTSERKISKLCMVLAANSDSIDDGVYYYKNTFWFMRRYDPAVTFTELDILFKQQIVIATLLDRDDSVENSKPNFTKLA